MTTSILTYGHVNHRRIMRRVSPGRTSLCDALDAALIEYTVSFPFDSFMYVFIVILYFQLFIGTREVTFRFSIRIYGGTINGGIVTGDDDFFVTLKTALKRTLTAQAAPSSWLMKNGSVYARLFPAPMHYSTLSTNATSVVLRYLLYYEKGTTLHRIFDKLIIPGDAQVLVTIRINNQNNEGFFPRHATPVQPVSNAKNPRSDEKKEVYAAMNNHFDGAKGYVQIQGASNQVNVDQLVNKKKLKVQRLRERAYLCCSVLFHAALTCRPDKSIELYTDSFIDKITISGERHSTFCFYCETQFFLPIRSPYELLNTRACLKLWKISWKLSARRRFERKRQPRYDNLRVTSTIDDVMEGKMHNRAAMITD